MTAVPVQEAVGRLSSAVDQLWDAVSELALIVLEDQPEAEGLAVTDQLVETVSEVQGAVAEARAWLAVGSSRGLPPVTELAPAVVALRAALVRYWRDVRGHEAVAALRAGTRQRGGEWPAWRRSAEVSALRCAEPMDDVAAALDACWQEVCRLAADAPEPARRPGAVARSSPSHRSVSTGPGHHPVPSDPPQKSSQQSRSAP
jgi:hypothetical protein